MSEEIACHGQLANKGGGTQMQASQDIEATMYFLAHDPVYDNIKPFFLQYFTSDGKPRNNVIQEDVSVPISDIRGKENKFTFSRNGFAILDLQSKMTYEDFEDAHKIEELYCEELAQCLLHYFHAESIQFFDRVVRRRHKDYPHIDPQTSASQQPARQVHVDSSPESLTELIRKINGDEANSMLKHKYIYVNVWKPLLGPVRDWPLAFCDAESLDSGDFVPSDLVYVDHYSGNMMVHHNPRQSWYYLSDQMPHELILIRQGCSENASGYGVPHSSFVNPLSKENDPLRESIEIRAIVYFPLDSQSTTAQERIVTCEDEVNQVESPNALPHGTGP